MKNKGWYFSKTQKKADSGVNRYHQGTRNRPGFSAFLDAKQREMIKLKKQLRAEAMTRGERMAVALNIILILLELWAARMVASRGWKNLVFYTQLSNALTALSSLALVGASAFGQSSGVTALRYTSVCMMVMTAVVTAAILVPMGGDPKMLLWGGSGLYHHVLCPALTTVSYLFFENHAGAGMIWLPMTVTLVYGLIMLWLNWKRIVDGPYPFFRVHHQSPVATVIWMAALVGMVGLISWAISLC